ncbi:MAG: redoxin domain-containing protein [bacterium]|nr:redoxin domain-containing protein [bacterium]
MNRKLVFAVAGLVFTGFVSLMVFGLFYASNPKEIPSALIGTKASNFSTVTFNGQPISLEQFKGHPVILNFWASWCVSCRQEAHIIETAHLKYTPKGAVFIGIAINDTREKSLGFIRKYGKTYLLGPDDEIGTISLNYGVSAVPETFFIDQEGVIRFKSLGPVQPGAIDEFLDSQL